MRAEGLRERRDVRDEVQTIQTRPSQDHSRTSCRGPPLKVSNNAKGRHDVG